jgi:hypothetical protein
LFNPTFNLFFTYSDDIVQATAQSASLGFVMSFISASFAQSSLTPSQSAFFSARGYLPPMSLFSPEEAEALADTLVRRIRALPAPTAPLMALQRPTPQRSISPHGPQGSPIHWAKTIHLRLPDIAAIGTAPKLVALATSILGQDVLLWGAELITKAPGKPHRWHVDVEHIEWDGITFWIALSNSGPQSTIKFIAGSHRLNVVPQQLGPTVNLYDDDAVIAAIERQAPAAGIGTASIVTGDIPPGDFTIFAGRAWHSTINETARTRHALILQYCRPSARVRVPRTYDIPSEWHFNQPWVLQVAGTDRFGFNHLYPAA